MKKGKALHSIQRQMMSLVLAALLFTFILTLGVFGLLYMTTQEHTAGAVSETLSTYAQLIENGIDQARNYSLTLLRAAEVQEPLRAIYFGLDSAVSLYTQEKRLSEFLMLSLNNAPWIDRIDVVGAEGQLYTSTSVIGAPSQETLISAVDMAATGEGRAVWARPVTYPQRITCARVIRSINAKDSFEGLGTLILWVDLDKLVAQSAFPSRAYQGEIFIEQDGDIIYPKHIDSESLPALEGKDAIQRVRGIRYITALQTGAKTGWRYSLVVPYLQVFMELFRTVAFFGIFLFLLLCAIFALSTRRMRRTTKALNRLILEMEKVGQGNFEVDPQLEVVSASSMETREISGRFVKMVHQLDTLINDGYRKQILLKDAQFKALQAQIDPHFLFNALDSINWLAKTNGQPQIAQIAKSLAALMRGSMDHTEAYGTLGEELKLIRHYTAIQQIRFGNRLSYHETVDEETLSIPIPRLMLQPLLENAIRYSVGETGGTCNVSLRIQMEEKDVLIEISDNGIGMSPETIPLILSGQIKTKGNGIGLRNVNERLLLLYGEAYALSIDSAPGAGTIVRFRVPVVQGGAPC